MASDSSSASGGRQTVQSYGAGGFRIAGQMHEGSVLVFRDRTVAWAVDSPASVTVEALAPVLAAGNVRVLLVGCGARAATLDSAVRGALRKAGIGVETMDTGAACRTFNVLLDEDREVAAALIAVP